MQNTMKKIAIYGKGGIGKSTTASNLSAALSQSGLRTMHIGCDPKADSTLMLCQGGQKKPVLEAIGQKGAALTLEDIVTIGYNGTICVEAGGPTPGIGCAGRGIIMAFETLESLSAYEIYKPDVVIYDVLGDVVCGGFAMPLRKGYAQNVFVVTSGEKMALYAANNIYRAVSGFQNRQYAAFSGLILNERNVADERRIVSEFAEEISSEIVMNIPRSEWVQRAEALGQTVVQAFPDSEMAACYRRLAQCILERCEERGG